MTHTEEIKQEINEIKSVPYNIWQVEALNLSLISSDKLTVKVSLSMAAVEPHSAHQTQQDAPNQPTIKRFSAKGKKF